MSASTIDIRDTATPALRSLLDSCAGKNINPVVGRAGVNYLKIHFRKLNAERANKLGGERTNFYAQAARGTNYTLLPDGVVLGINQVGIRQRFYGGTIKAGKQISRITGKPTQYLTIPACSEAYGKRAGEFYNLRFRMNKEKTSGSLSDKTTGQTLFWLKKEVTQKEDKSVLPTDQELSDHIVRELGSYLSTIGGLKT